MLDAERGPVKLGVLVVVCSVETDPAADEEAAGRSAETREPHAGGEPLRSTWFEPVQAPVDVGVAPAPPPRTMPFAVKSPELAIVVVLEKYGIPPLVPLASPVPPLAALIGLKHFVTLPER